MKNRILFIMLAIVLCASTSWAAWDKTKPADDELLSDAPALLRANFAALEAGTDLTLQVTNAKVAPNADIADTKLAQISTAGKVHGSSLTNLSSVPSGAGLLPDANLSHKLKADSGDTTPQFLDSLIDTTQFQISAGDLLQIKSGILTLTETANLSVIGNMYVGGYATYGNFPITPSEAPTTDYQVANKKYVDDLTISSGVYAYKSGDQTMTDATYQKVTYTTEVEDLNNEWASSRFTAKQAGLYIVSASYLTESISWGDGDSSLIVIYVNGEGLYYEKDTSLNDTTHIVAISKVIRLNVNDYIEIYAKITRGANVDIRESQGCTNVSIYRIGG